MSGTERSPKQLKIALLIASPYGKLRGPINDARHMEQALTKLQFDTIRCYGESATQQKILEHWEELILKLQSAKTQNPSVPPIAVIYYAGHGGLVEAPDKNSLRYQFLVPYDYSYDDETGFRGILDIQIGHLLGRMTDATKNVTVILDCCHSGRMARDPSNASARPRSIGVVKHATIKAHIEKLKLDGQLKGKTYADSNPFAVRVVAAATTESAWEFEKEKDVVVGALTNHLVAILNDLPKDKVSWRTLMLRVRELVNVEFPTQHPHVEGPGRRFLFSTQEDSAESHSLFVDHGIPMMRAGTLAGVKEGNVYLIMPPGRTQPSTTDRLCRAKVVGVNTIASRLEPFDKTTSASIVYAEALAFLEAIALHKWVVDYPKDDRLIRSLLEESKYLRPGLSKDREKRLVRITREGPMLCAYDNNDNLLSSRLVKNNNDEEEAATATIRKAETLARGHHLLTLEAGSGEEAFSPDLHIRAGVVIDPKNHRYVLTDGSAELTEGEKLFLSLENRGSFKVYVNIFDINVAGHISLISADLEILAERGHTVGAAFGLLQGRRISWPKDIPRHKKLSETLIFIVTSRSVDLRHLEGRAGETRGCGPSQSLLEFITKHVAFGVGRDVETERSLLPIRYDVIRIPFTLIPKKGE